MKKTNQIGRTIGGGLYLLAALPVYLVVALFQFCVPKREA